MEKDDLIKQNITGVRLKIALWTQRKSVEYVNSVIIICYVAMVLIFLAFEDGVFESNKPLEWVVQVFELIFLMLFTLDIVFKTLSYGRLYWRDYLNIIDLFMLVLIFILLILDMGVSNVKASMIFRLRGVLRIG